MQELMKLISFHSKMKLICYFIGMLPIKVKSNELKLLLNDAKDQHIIEINLEKQIIKRYNSDTIHFDIDSFRKYCLLNGFDDIGIV